MSKLKIVEDKPRVWNHLNAKNRERRVQTFQPSMTVPDQTMSLRTLVDRYAKGMLQPEGKEPIYHDEDGTGIDIRKMDLVDIQALAMDVSTMIQANDLGRQKHEESEEQKLYNDAILEKAKEMADKILNADGGSEH